MFKKLKEDYYINNKGKKVIIILFIYRLGNKVWNLENKYIRKLLLSILEIIYQIFVYFPYHIEIPFSAEIDGGLRLPHQHNIVLNGKVKIGKNCTLYHQVTLGMNDFLPYPNAPVIGDNVYIGAGAKIIGNVKISDNCKIGANAVVVKDLLKGEVAISKQTVIRK